MAEFKVGDYIIFNKDGCLSPVCLEYHAVVTEELRKNCYMLHTLDEYIRGGDHRFGVYRDFKCLGRYMVIDEKYTNGANFEVDISTLLSGEQISKCSLVVKKHVY